MPRAFLPICAFLGVFASAPAAQADEDEWLLGVEPTWGILSDQAETHHGAGGLLFGALGLTPGAWLSASLGAIHYPDQADPTAFEGTFGVMVALDVLRIVPFLDAAVGLDVTGDELTPFLRAGLGADYFLDPTWSLGFVGRTRPLYATSKDTSVQLGLRLTYRGEL